MRACGALMWLAGRAGHRVLARLGMRSPAVAGGAGWAVAWPSYGIRDVRFRARIRGTLAAGLSLAGVMTVAGDRDRSAASVVRDLLGRSIASSPSS
jgi:hypothetical protein